jgi:hypothetical protein
VGSRAGLDASEYRKNLLPPPESNPGRPAHSQSLYLLSYSGLYFSRVYYRCAEVLRLMVTMFYK